MKINQIWSYIIIAAISLSCVDNILIVPVPESKRILIRSWNDSTHNFGGSYTHGIWRNNTIYCISPFREITVNSNFEVIRDTILELFKRYKFLAPNKTGDSMLIVKSIYPDVSVGALVLRDNVTGAVTELRDSSFEIGSARFLKGGNKCIYYSYGNPGKSVPAGYYRLDIGTGADSFLLPFDSEVGTTEVIHGFDVSPDDRKLIIPMSHFSGYPKMGSYDLETGILETLKVDFIHQYLWLRYNSTGSKILYSNHPYGAVAGTANDTSEVGIIDIASMSKQILNVNVSAPYPSISLFPDWSSDDEHIVYGNAPGPMIEPLGSVGYFSLYLLTNVR
jgi:hypothetical protein